MNGMNRLFVIFLGVTLILSITLVFVQSLTIIEPSTDNAFPGLVAYTPEQKQGRWIYVREGCVYCHTQQVRPLNIDARYLYGTRPSIPEDYVYDRPHLMGTERIGQDLSNIGRKYAGDEGRQKLLKLLLNPRSIYPASLMPSFDYLSQTDITNLVSYLQYLGSWKQAYSASIEEWRPSYWKEMDNKTEEVKQRIEKKNTNFVWPVFVVLGVVMAFVFIGIGWFWKRGHHRDSEEPARRMVRHQE